MTKNCWTVFYHHGYPSTPIVWPDTVRTTGRSSETDNFYMIHYYSSKTLYYSPSGLNNLDYHNFIVHILSWWNLVPQVV